MVGFFPSLLEIMLENRKKCYKLVFLFGLVCVHYVRRHLAPYANASIRSNVPEPLFQLPKITAFGEGSSSAQNHSST